MKVKIWYNRPPVGTKVKIVGNHPWVGHYGKIIQHIDFTNYPAVEVELEDPDFRCFVDSPTNIEIQKV